MKRIFTGIFNKEQTTFVFTIYFKIAQRGKQAAETQYNTERIVPKLGCNPIQLGSEATSLSLSLNIRSNVNKQHSTITIHRKRCRFRFRSNINAPLKRLSHSLPSKDLIMLLNIFMIHLHCPTMKNGFHRTAQRRVTILDSRCIRDPCYRPLYQSLSVYTPRVLLTKDSIIFDIYYYFSTVKD